MDLVCSSRRRMGGDVGIGITRGDDTYIFENYGAIVTCEVIAMTNGWNESFGVDI